VQNDRSPGFIAQDKARRHRFLSERQMARALHQVLQEEVVGALLASRMTTCERYSVSRISRRYRH